MSYNFFLSKSLYFTYLNTCLDLIYSRRLLKGHDHLYYLGTVPPTVECLQGCQDLSYWRGTGDIENEDRANGIFQIRRNQTTKSLLTSCIPQLQSASGPLIIDIFANKIDTDRRLYKQSLTFSFSSNWLLTNLSIMLVLPVPLSPRKIIL